MPEPDRREDLLEGSHSSVPSRPLLPAVGLRPPLHLVLAHEYIHQIDLAFSRLRHPPRSSTGWRRPARLSPASIPAEAICREERPPVRPLLRSRDWGLLTPAYGTWIAR